MKKIYLDVAGTRHTLYRALLQYPPEGYEFTTQDTNWDKVTKFASGIDTFYSFQKKFLSKLIPMNLAKAYLEQFKKPPKGTVLTYATGHLVFRKEPWVVDFEYVTQLAGYGIRHFKKYKKLIEKVLASGYCKKIICWTEASKRSVLWNLNCKEFEHKIEVVPLAVRKKGFTKTYDEKRVKLLFVGSANIPGEFELRGGREVLEAFSYLKKKYDNLELVIRSDMASEIKSKYSQIEGIRIIDTVIPWEELEQEFKSTDIFLLPANSSQDVAVLDAMSYELPVVTSDVWANPEWVQDGKTGFVITKSGKIPYYIGNYIPDWSSPECMRVYRTADPEVVAQLVEKTSILIEDKELRRRMGKAGRKQIETGNFSITKRNEKLKRIFDEATAKAPSP
jgi:glycosyltransferase involved in cell wall biosynthesis